MPLTDRDGNVLATDEERQCCEVWSRVMGYHRPVSNWNAGKQSEWRDRRMYKEPGKEAQ